MIQTNKLRKRGTKTVSVLFLFAIGQCLLYFNVNQQLLGGSSLPPEGPTMINGLQLAKQVKVQKEFIQMIEESQKTTDCGDARILVADESIKPYDGFALEVRMMSYFLQIAVASQRALVIKQEFYSAYAPNCSLPLNPPVAPPTTTPKESDNEGHSFHCLWNKVSECTERENVGGRATEYAKPDPMGVGILEDREDSYYFNTKYFGAQRIVVLDQFPHVDRTSNIHVLPYWERTYGTFWVRSQVSSYWWTNYKTELLKEEIEPRLTKLEEPYIGFQIRMTDNVYHLRKHFSRNATITRSFERYMGIANDIRKENTKLRHIFVATDNEDAAAAAVKNNYEGWTFHIQDGVTRGGKDEKMMWFQESRSDSVGLIGADLEMLRRADYLVGSFQSNVFRLAAELNTGYHTKKYLWDQRRIFSVDVEWYQDP